MTSQGAANSLNSLDEIEAERACLLYGNVRIQAFSSTEEELGKILNGDCADINISIFERALLNKNAYCSRRESGKIDIAIDNSWDPP